MAFCKKCGQELRIGNRFCSKCGNPVPVANLEPPRPFYNYSTHPNDYTPNHPSPLGYKETTKSPLATSAGVVSIIWAVLMLMVILLQLSLVASGQADSWLTLVALWNALISFLYIAIGVGIFQRKKWAWSWGIGSNSLNLILGIYQFIRYLAWVELVFLPLELFIIIALESTKAAIVESETKREAI